MATEPIALFSRAPDPVGVAKLLRTTLGAKVHLQGADESWSKATVTTGRLWSKRQLVFTHDSAYYSPPNWAVQLAGMHGYFSKFPDGPNKGRVMALIPTFGFALGTMHDPDFQANDERLELIFQVARFLDAVLFLPSSLRDAGGRIIFSAGGESDTDAVWPRGNT